MNNRRRLFNLVFASILALGSLLGGTKAVLAATTYNFGNITTNSVADVNTGESQLFVDVTCDTAGQVTFTFRNTGPLASSITDVYFGAGHPPETLLAFHSIIESGDAPNGSNVGVDFEQNASPGNLPAAQDADPEFVTTLGFSADSEPQTQPNGVNPGETLGIVFTLQPGKTCADVVGELNSGALRVGIHVQGFDGGGSESFVSNTNTPPACVVSGNVFTITDAEGLATISGTAVNVTTNPALPHNANGATQVVVTATIVNPYKDASLQLTATDLGGLTALCGFSKPAQPDTTAPVCKGTTMATDANGVKYYIQKAQDPESGIVSAVPGPNNNNISQSGPGFVPGTTAIVSVYGYRINTTISARMEVVFTNGQGLKFTCDPVEELLVRENGKPATITHKELPQAASKITVTNGNPGIGRLEINVNGTVFKVNGLRADTEQLLDVSGAMVAGNNNTISLTAFGQAGAKAKVVIEEVE